MIKNGVSSLFRAVFGQLNWNSPNWLLFLRNKAQKSPILFWSAATLALCAIIIACSALSWYQHRPKPIYTTALITAPSITPNEETLNPSPLLLNFGVEDKGFNPKSVAPLDEIGKEVTQGLEISPAIKGQWYWNSDNQLSFVPKEDWPANQTFTITLAKSSVAANANLEKYHFSFSTQPFQATLSDFKFYQDPVHPDKKSAVATIQFNYPVNTEALENNTTLQFEAQDKSHTKFQPLGFNYSYDANKRVAYLHSEGIQITDLERFLRLTIGKKVSSSTQTGFLSAPVTSTLLIPDATTMLKVVSTSATIVRNEKDRPEQVLNIETTLGITDSEFNRHVQVYLLPQEYPATSVEKAKPNYEWQNPGEVSASILALSKPLVKQAIPAEHHYSNLHSFKFVSSSPQYLYIKIDKGMKGLGDFVLNEGYSAVLAVPALPQEISFLHQGSLMALGGEEKLN